MTVIYVFIVFKVIFPCRCDLTKTLYAVLVCPIQATCPFHLILHDFITWIIFSKDLKSWNSLLCVFLRSVVMSSLSGPGISHATLFLNIRSLCSSLTWDIVFHSHVKQKAELTDILCPFFKLFACPIVFIILLCIGFRTGNLLLPWM